MNVYWLEQTADDVPADNQWLSAGEIQCLSRMQFAKASHGLAIRSLDGEARCGRPP